MSARPAMHRASGHDGEHARERGLAMVAVLLVLMALFVLCAPFLVTVRNADQASSEASDRYVLRVSLDSASRHAAAKLSGSHTGRFQSLVHRLLGGAHAHR